MIQKYIKTMKRIIEFFQDENGKLSSNRLLTLMFGVTAIVISLYFTFSNTLNGDYNVLIGILTSSAIGNKIASSFTNKDKSINITTDKIS